MVKVKMHFLERSLWFFPHFFAISSHKHKFQEWEEREENVMELLMSALQYLFFSKKESQREERSEEQCHGQ